MAEVADVMLGAGVNMGSCVTVDSVLVDWLFEGRCVSVGVVMESVVESNRGPGDVAKSTSVGV